MREITQEYVDDLRRKIAERAKKLLDSPELRPEGMAVPVVQIGPLIGPYVMMEACLIQAAKEIAPGFDHQLARFIAHPPEILLGLYRGDDV